MEEKKFIKLCKFFVTSYVNEHLDKSDDKFISEDDVYIVWMCKTLQNSKALLSTTLPDGMYYELTWNGDKGELYIDAYKKFQNRCIPVRVEGGEPFQRYLEGSDEEHPAFN